MADITGERIIHKPCKTVLHEAKGTITEVQTKRLRFPIRCPTCDTICDMGDDIEIKPFKPRIKKKGMP